MSNYITHLKIPGTISDQPIELASPTSNQGKPVINILCGQNAAGKSYVLNDIRLCLEGQWAELVQPLPHSTRSLVDMDPQNGIHARDIYIRMSARYPQPRTFSPKGLGEDMKRAGIVGLDATPKTAPSDRVSFHPIFSKFVLEELGDHLDPAKMITTDHWLNDRPKRMDALNGLVIEERLYKCQAHTELIAAVENILDARLYLRITKKGKTKEPNQIEFALLYGDGSTMTYSQWSDGQRAVFYLLTLVDEFRPDILLIDELENHLHPAFMSQVLEFIKTRVPQSILATHHPHLVFSEHVDKVIYLETNRPPAHRNPPPELPYTKAHTQIAPPRRIATLDTAFDKLAAIYGMFAQQDKQLLIQSQRVAEQAEIEFYQSLTDIFTSSVIPTSQRLTPDTQTREFTSALRRMGLLGSNEDITSILDYGAGLGRTPGETSKLSVWQLGGEIKWTCWDIYPDARQHLGEMIRQGKFDGVVPADFDDIADRSLDACVFANVLHELNPNQFGEAVSQCHSKLLPSQGLIIIMELYPLLANEKFAVPYEPAHLVNIFQSLGFLASYQQVPVRDSSAYCLVAKQGEVTDLDADRIARVVEKEWDAICRNSVQSYSLRQSLEDYRGYRDMIQELTTIASVSAWNQGVWT